MSENTTGIRSRLGITMIAAGLALAPACATISTQQEVQMGRQAAAEVNQQLPIVRDQAIDNYINQLGNSIAQKVKQRGIPYTFHVVNAKEVNAFSLPGGFVYVNRGLIERADNMSELGGVLAHEIAHVVERHSVERIAKAQEANTAVALVYGVLLGRNPSAIEQVGLQVGGTAVFAHYSRDAEREADRDAVHFTVAAGIDPHGLITMFQKLLAEQQSQPGAVDTWFATHPGEQERIQEVQQEINTIPAASLKNLTTNTQDFMRFKQEIHSLPAAPQ